MENYPKFLNSTPKFWGLTLPDIILFALTLNVFYHIGVPVLVALLVASVLVILRRLIVKWVDFKALFVGVPRTRSLSWGENLRQNVNKGGRV